MKTKLQEKRNKKTKALLIALFLIIALLLVFVLCNLGMIIYGNAYTYSSDEIIEFGDIDCIIILGARVYDDGNLSLPLRQRVETGKDLYSSGVSSKILLSGDHSRENYDEVNAMKGVLMNSGIDAEVIFTDHAGFDTYDSMYRAKEIFQAKRIVIVTQKFHLTRAIFIARSLGLEAYGVAADENSRYFNLKTEVRELFARPKYILDAIFKPQPKYLGETIPIWGEASLSDG